MEAKAMIFASIFGILFLIPVALYVFNVYCWYRIMQKAGHDNLGLIAIFPPLTIVLIIMLAFTDWHAVKEPEVKSVTTGNVS
jgi:integral membrane sensor domain MASE1